MIYLVPGDESPGLHRDHELFSGLVEKTDFVIRPCFPSFVRGRGGGRESG